MAVIITLGRMAGLVEVGAGDEGDFATVEVEPIAFLGEGSGFEATCLLLMFVNGLEDAASLQNNNNHNC